MKKGKSVLYVNYSPYENAGKILDYLLDNFVDVYLFSIAFHPLGKKQKKNRIAIYRNKKIIGEETMRYIGVHPKLVFIMIPLRSVINFLQILWHTTLIRRKHGKIDIFFSVNAFTACGGIIFKKIGLVKKTIFWVWDYYPMNDPRPVVRFMRWLYWQFDKRATYSDSVVYLNNRLAAVRKKAGLIKKNARCSIVPIGTDIENSKPRKKPRIVKVGFIGVLKRSQGLDMIFNVSDLLKKSFPGFTLEIIGSGPDQLYFKKRVRETKLNANFYGYVPDDALEKILKQVFAKCTIGIAPYIPDESSLSFYGDPAKVKRYLSFGLPTIITEVFDFSKELETKGAGIIVDYYFPESLVGAIKKIMSKYRRFSRNAVELNKKFYYKDLYPRMFKF